VLRYSLIIMEVVRDTTVVPGNYGHDGFLLLAHKRPSPFFYTYPHKKPSFTLITDFVVDS